MPYGYPQGLLGGIPQTAATPPFVPQTGGLLGGAGGATVPQKRGLLAGIDPRMFGMMLLAGAQDPNIGQTLGRALMAGRESFQQREQQDYQRGRQEREDELYEEYRREQIETQRQEAERLRARGLADVESKEQLAGLVNEWTAIHPERKAEMQVALLSGPDAVLKLMAPPEPEEGPSASDYVYDSSRGQLINKLTGEAVTPEGIAPKQYKPNGSSGAGSGASGPTPGQILTQVGKLIGKGMSPEEAASFVRRGVDEMTFQGGISAVEPPPVPDGERPEPKPADTTVSEIESIAAAHPELVAGINAMIADKLDPQEILKRLKARTGGR